MKNEGKSYIIEDVRELRLTEWKYILTPIKILEGLDILETTVEQYNHLKQKLILLT